MSPAAEVIRAMGWVISDLTYNQANEAARKNRCTYLYDTGNGSVGQAVWHEALGCVKHSLTLDGRNWIV